MTITADPHEGTAAAVRTRSNAAMSLTYSDFLYTRSDYYSNEDYGNGLREERRSLPSDFKPIQETKIPFLIQNSEAENNDFIIIAEFSEIEGPIPLCTVPNDAAEKTDIKLSDFVVHLMSTDYQVNTVGQFRICQDTQVMRKNVFPDAHVFMQYFTLYDLKARGFVRPFCFGFVTKDHVKLDKYMNYLISEFGKVTSVLEYCNREWFSKELNLYLDKLQNAKDSFIQEHCSGGSGAEDDNQSDEFVDSETVTLAQIAHQYSEIHNILTIVQSFENSNKPFCEDLINDIKLFFQRNFDSNLGLFLKKSGISLDPSDDNVFNSSLLNDSLNVPLIHPLRPKGEPLRPLTVLGGLGTVHLVRKLMQIYKHCKMDTIFSEMTEQTNFFLQHFDNLRMNPSQAAEKDLRGTNSPGKSSGISSSADLDNSTASGSNNSNSSTAEISYSETDDDQNNKRTGFNNALTLELSFLRKKELQQIIEKLHLAGPVISDNKSGSSYHTVSEEDSDLNIPSQTDTIPDVDCGASSAMESTLDTASVTEPSSKPSDDGSIIPDGNDQWSGLKANATLNSFSSDEEISLGSPPASLHDTTEETIMKEPWWVHASRKLVRGVPGYGLANFFRRYHECAHHILYSILLGRPIVICGEEKMSRKVGRIITALVPLVPLPRTDSTSTEENGSKSWRLLRWHRGILVQTHIEAYRLIGLCIPEKLEVHDLIPPRLVNLVTILSVDKKSILGGPAYSGQLLQNFEKKMQKHFYNSDVSLLSYIGGIYAEIEAKVYMYKSLEDKYKKGRGTASSNIHLLFKELNLRASDVEIVKYLGSLLSDSSECVNIL